jgi:RimJ/RimL family protein N-acetyltransferase
MRTPAASFRFQLLREQDLAMLAGWLARPHVRHWWHTPAGVDELRLDYLLEPDPPSVRAFIALQHERPIGFLQCYQVMGCADWWPEETDPGAWGTDQFLADAADLGQGLGSAMVRAFVDAVLFADPQVTVVQTDPDPGNTRAIRAYLRAGFAVAGPVQTPDGPALLMRRRRGGS